MKLALFIFGLIVVYLLIGFVTYVILCLIDERICDREDLVMISIVAWPAFIIGYVICTICELFEKVDIPYNINGLVKKIVKFIKRKR